MANERTPEEMESHEVYTDAQLAARGWQPAEIAALRAQQWGLVAEAPKRAAAAPRKADDDKK